MKTNLLQNGIYSAQLCIAPYIYLNLSFQIHIFYNMNMKFSAPKSSDSVSMLTLQRFSSQVSEASVNRNRSTIIVPAGSTRDEGWAAFRNILAEIDEANRLFIMPNQVWYLHLRPLEISFLKF